MQGHCHLLAYSARVQSGVGNAVKGCEAGGFARKPEDLPRSPITLHPQGGPL